MSNENVSLPVAEALASALSKIEAYVPTEYVDNSEPDINAEHLNHAEQGIMRVTNLLNAAVDVIQGQESRLADAETKIGTAALTGGMTDLSSGVNSLYSNLAKFNIQTTILNDWNNYWATKYIPLGLFSVDNAGIATNSPQGCYRYGFLIVFTISLDTGSGWRNTQIYIEDNGSGEDYRGRIFIRTGNTTKGGWKMFAGTKIDYVSGT